MGDDYKVWFDEDGQSEAHAVNIMDAASKDEAVFQALRYLKRLAVELDMDDICFEFNYIQTPEGDFKKEKGDWVRINQEEWQDWEDPDPGDADDADRPPGTSGSWGEA